MCVVCCLRAYSHTRVGVLKFCGCMCLPVSCLQRFGTGKKKKRSLIEVCWSHKKVDAPWFPVFVESYSVSTKKIMLNVRLHIWQRHVLFDVNATQILVHRNQNSAGFYCSHQSRTDLYIQCHENVVNSTDRIENQQDWEPLTYISSQQ